MGRITKPATTDRPPTTDNRPMTHRQVYQTIFQSDLKNQKKNLNIFRTKRTLRWNKKIFFFICKGIKGKQIKQSILEGGGKFCWIHGKNYAFHMVYYYIIFSEMKQTVTNVKVAINWNFSIIQILQILTKNLRPSSPNQESAQKSIRIFWIFFIASQICTGWRNIHKWTKKINKEKI